MRRGTDLDDDAGMDQWETEVNQFEDCVLGEAMLDPLAIPKLSCTYSDFFRPRYQQIFRLLATAVAEGRPVKPQLVFPELKSAGLIDHEYDRRWFCVLVGKAVPGQAQGQSGLLRNARFQYRVRQAISRGRLTDPYSSASELVEEIAALASPIALSGATLTIPGCDVLDRYLESLANNSLPQLIKQGVALNGIEVGAELITVLASPPARGKTALASQILFDALALDPSLTVVVANAEMSFEVLLRRELARLTFISSRSLRFGELSQVEHEQVAQAAAILRQQITRVSTLADPMNLQQLLRLTGTTPGLVVVDYIQKFAPSDKDARQGVNEVMAGLRVLARAGWAVLAISATSRSKDKELTLSSLRESSEIEYNADSVYLLQDEGPAGSDERLRAVTLKHVKNRHDSHKDIELVFNAPQMEFTKRLEPTTSWQSCRDLSASNPFQTPGAF